MDGNYWRSHKNVGSLNPSRQLQWISRWSAHPRSQLTPDTRDWLTWVGGGEPGSNTRGCPGGPGPGTATSARTRPWPRYPSTASDSLAADRTCREWGYWGHSRDQEAETSLHHTLIHCHHCHHCHHGESRITTEVRDRTDYRYRYAIQCHKSRASSV